MLLSLRLALPPLAAAAACPRLRIPCPSPTPAAGAGIPPPLIPHSRLPAALVASLEVAAVATFAAQMAPWLTELRWACLLLGALSAGFFALHWR